MKDAHLAQDLDFIFSELKANTVHRDRIRRKIKKIKRQGRLHWDWNNTDWGYRICCAELANGRYSWKGWECRSDWAWRMSTERQVYPRWDGKPCKLLVMAEQGLGDEIMYASCLDELFAQNTWDHPLTVECDPRLMTIYRRSFPQIRFIDRFRDDKGTSKYPDQDYARGEYDAFIPLGNVVKLYRTKIEDFPGAPYLETRPGLPRWLLNYPRPWIGISWQGRQGHLDPKDLMHEEGTYISLQYDSNPPDDLTKPAGLVEAHEQKQIHVPPIDLRGDIESVFSLVNCLDKVVSVPTTVIHIAGALGVECHVIRPPDIYPGDVPNKPGLHNRLRYEFGRWQGRMAWYRSVRLYRDLKTFKKANP